LRTFFGSFTVFSHFGHLTTKIPPEKEKQYDKHKKTIRRYVGTELIQQQKTIQKQE
jgi:hypothetical protein